MAASYICNRIPHSALNMETPYLSHLKNIGARSFVHIKSTNRLGHTSWEGMLCVFSETESNSYRIWNPKTRREVESRNVNLIETPPNLLPATRGLSPRKYLELLSYDFSDDTLYDSDVSHEDMLRDVQNYTSTLDFNVKTPARMVDRRNFTWGIFDCGNFARGSCTGEIVTSTSARAGTRTSAYICFCGTKGN